MKHMMLRLSISLVMMTSSMSFAQTQAVAPELKATKFGAWYLRCLENADAGKKPVTQCEVMQMLQVKNKGQDVKLLTVAFSQRMVPADPKTKAPAKKNLLITTVVPLNMFLPSGFIFLDGEKELKKTAYRNCNQVGCWTQSVVDPLFLKAFSNAKEITARMQLMTGQNVNLKFSSVGLTQALEALNKAQP